MLEATEPLGLQKPEEAGIAYRLYDVGRDLAIPLGLSGALLQKLRQLACRLYQFIRRRRRGRARGGVQLHRLGTHGNSPTSSGDQDGANSGLMSM